MLLLETSLYNDKKLVLGLLWEELQNKQKKLQLACHKTEQSKNLYAKNLQAGEFVYFDITSSSHVTKSLGRNKHNWVFIFLQQNTTYFKKVNGCEEQNLTLANSQTVMVGQVLPWHYFEWLNFTGDVSLLQSLLTPVIFSLFWLFCLFPNGLSDPAFKCFPSSGFLLSLKKGVWLFVINWLQLRILAWNGLCPCRGMSNGKWITFIPWSFWRSSESFDGVPCRKLTLSFPALLSLVSRECQSLGLSCQQLLTPRVSAASPIPIRIGQQISWEVNFLSQLCLQEKSVAHLEWRTKVNLMLPEMVYHMCSIYNHQMGQGMNVLTIFFCSGS